MKYADQDSGVREGLERLRRAAQATRAWPAMQWRTVSSPEPRQLELSHGVFQGLVLQPGQPVTLATDLSLPAEIAATPLAGDALDVTVNSVFPTALALDGISLLEDDIPTVALGPALIRVCSRLHPLSNGELRLTIRPPHNQTSGWLQVLFSTPGLRERFALLDLAWARLALAARLTASGLEHDAVRHAAERVPEALDSMPTESLAGELDALANILSPLADKIAGLSVHVIGHSHIDMNWLWTWPDTVQVIVRDARSILRMMDDYPEMTFTHSQPATYAVLQQEAPDLFARVLAHIREGRWEPATMTWVEGDTNMASGEAMARQLLEAVTYSREELGFRPHVFLAPDTFGHAGTLPQLASSAGATVYYHHRANPGCTSVEQMLWPAYWWEGQDGSRLLALSTPTYGGDVTAGALAGAALAALDQGQRVALLFHGVGDHGGGPARGGLDTLRRLKGLPAFLTARCSTIGAYAQALLQSGVALPTHRGESTTIFEGCYTTQSEMKRFNRHGENLLCTADSLAAVAGLPYPAPLREAWRKLLFHQFHDILDGSGIHESYEQSEEDFESVVSAAQSVVEQALSKLESGIPYGHIAVTNQLAWDRLDVVVVPELHGTGTVWLRDDQGRLTPGQYTAQGLCFVAVVSAFSTTGYQVVDGVSLPTPPAVEAVPALSPAAALAQGATIPPAAETAYFRIDTPAFRVFLRRDSGILVSLFDKRVGRELVGFGMRRFSDYPETARTDLALNVLQILDELPHELTAWHLDEVQRETSLLRGATTRVVESGPVLLVLEVRHTVRSSTIVQLITFYRDLPRIDIDTTIDWRELGDNAAGVADLKVAFTAQLEECQAWFENPYGAVQRPAGGQEVPALRWADVGGSNYGLAILNDCRYGYDVLGSRIRLTLVRGPYDPDAIADQGIHSARCGLVPHAGDWRDAGIVRLAAGFNQPLVARIAATGTARTFGVVENLAWRPRVSDSSVLIAALKPSHRGSGRIIRLYESAGRSVEVTVSSLPETSNVSEVTVVEDAVATVPRQGDSIQLSFRPWQVRSLLVSG